MLVVPRSHPSKLFPLIMADDLDRVRRFYLSRLEAIATFDLPNYLQIRFGPSDDAPELAFMRPGAQPHPAFEHPFGGRGVVVSVPVENADIHAKALLSRGFELLSTPADMPWGWRSFSLRDPTGLVLEFFHWLPETP